MIEENEDASLIRQCQAGDLEAFGKLVEKYEQPVFNAALRIVGDYESAKDLMQTIFLKAFTHLDAIDPSRPFFSWLYRVTLNESINFGKREAKLSPFSEGYEIPSDETPEAAVARKELSESVALAVAQLDSKYRKLVVLKYIVGLSYEEISQTLQIPVKKVKSRLYSARLLLRSVLKEVSRGIS